MNVRRFSCKKRTGLVIVFVLFSSLGLASPSHAKTYKCSKGGSFEINVLEDIYGKYAYVDSGWSCKGEAKIPKSATYTQIGPDAFNGANALTSISIPANVWGFGSGAFANTKKLKSIKFAKGSKLEGIDSSAFDGATALTSISIPASVRYIGSNSFANTKKLKSIKFAKGSKLAKIEYSAFFNSGIKSITIPAKVTSIDEYALSGASSLTSITVSKANAKFSSVNGVLFNKSRTKLIYFPSKKPLKAYVTPASVTSIAAGAFEDTSLAAITISSNVKNIGSYAFLGGNLNSINVSGSNAFFSSVDGVLYNKSKSKIVSFPGKKDFSRYVFPDTVSTIGAGAFANIGITSLTIPNSVKIIGESAFSNNRLTSLEVPPSVTAIGYGAFANNRLTMVKLMGDGLFSDDEISAPFYSIFYDNPSTLVIFIPGGNGDYCNSDGFQCYQD